MLHDIFDNTARRHPDRIAVEIPPGPGRPLRLQITYAQLLAESEALAAHLRPAASPDAVLAILLPRDSHLNYMAQLAVLKAGAAFTCIDPAFPDSMLHAVLEDSAGPLVLTDAAGSARLMQPGIRPAAVLDLSKPLPAGLPSTPHHPPSPTQNHHLAYVIYTSGTTGKPKGVQIEHHSIVNLVTSDITEFGLTPDDRVGQGSSAAYDSSIEETWLAFAVGATLVVMDDHTSRMGPDLVPWMRRERITVFCPPPTLLRTTGCREPSRELPDLRLLYVGGEALTDDLVERWAPGRRLVNGYGPTECTVTVVRGDIHPGREITIGRPVPGHTAWVLDPDLNPVAHGEPGELCLAGPGLARGYRNREDLTREKFPLHPSFGRICRTGDLVRRNADGDLVYLGRIDAQVKLRGYRIELEAIESHLLRCEGIRQAACRVQGSGSEALLAAHILPNNADTPPDFAAVRNDLRRELPAYMVPARFGLIDALPRSVGGKVDRRRLPDLPPDGEDPAEREVTPPASPQEALIISAFAAALGRHFPISTTDDFFLDLGGDSLSAVAVICRLREHPEGASITTRDVYQARTAAALAARLGATPSSQHFTRHPRAAVLNIPARPLLVTLGQCPILLIRLIAIGAAAHIACFDLLPAMLDRFGILGTLLLEPLLAAAALLAYTLSSIACTAVLKWTLIGRYTPIRAPAWSGYFFRHWIVQNTARTIPWGLFAGTTIYGLVLRLLGARIGRRVHIHRGVNLEQGGWDLLTLGDDVSIGRDAHLGLVELDQGSLCIGPVEIRDHATIEVRSAVGPHTVIESRGHLTALSWLAEGQRIPEGESWDGVPAAPLGPAPSTSPIDPRGSLPPWLHAAAHLTFALLGRAGAALPILAAIAALAALTGTSAADAAAWLNDPAWSASSLWTTAALVVLTMPLWLAARALALRSIGRVHPGVFSPWSIQALRAGHKTAELESVGLWLTGTLFWPLWLRLAGARIGRGCEISTISDVIPESLSIGEESFFADGIYLGGPRTHRGTLTIAPTALGRGTFLGNHVVIPPGSTLTDDLFLGVCTVADPSLRQGSSWFGHPPLELPRREVVTIDRRLTHSPGPLRYTNRLFWESLRFALPLPLLLLSPLWFEFISRFDDTPWAIRAFLAAPLATLTVLLASCLGVIALKWILLGRARPGQHPLWSCWCSRWDFLYVVWQFYALGTLIMLEGTLLLAFFLRAMGARIGRRVVLGPGMGQVADPDMITIGDEATVSANYQAHSFEDRVLKLAPVHVHARASIGEAAVLFYGSTIGREAWVSPNSVVMKSETLHPGLAYSGCPVQSLPTMAPRDQPITPAAAPTPHHRSPALDLARGLAVIGMIFVHLVPNEFSDTITSPADAPLLDRAPIAIAQFMEGKSAALFCILAGMAWAAQARPSSPTSIHTTRYFLRRAAALASIGLALHTTVWPTEVLIPLACMMLIAIALHRLGHAAITLSILSLLTATPFIPRLFAPQIAADWTGDGGHLADTTFPPTLATLRALTIDGNYPLIPWLAFPLLGMLLFQHINRPAPNQRTTPRRLFILSLILWIPAQAWTHWSHTHESALGTLAPLLTSTWVPTSLPFFLTTGAWAITIITGLLCLLPAAPTNPANPRPRALSTILQPLARFGRASLTHYLLHILLLYQPLNLLLGGDDWSPLTGLFAFFGYLLIALPLTHLWFQRFSRGPIESLWARASGR